VAKGMTGGVLRDPCLEGGLADCLLEHRLVEMMTPPSSSLRVHVKP
jgi:hypothetical protein